MTNEPSSIPAGTITNANLVSMIGPFLGPTLQEVDMDQMFYLADGETLDVPPSSTYYIFTELGALMATFFIPGQLTGPLSLVKGPGSKNPTEYIHIAMKISVLYSGLLFLIMAIYTVMMVVVAMCDDGTVSIEANWGTCLYGAALVSSTLWFSWSLKNYVQVKNQNSEKTFSQFARKFETRFRIKYL